MFWTYCLLILNIISIHADFFAFRKLKNPTTKNTLYFLYDIHASLEKDSKFAESLKPLINEIISDSMKPGSVLDMYKQIEAGISRLDNEIIKPIRNNLPNLIKQHNDLIDIVHRYNVSLIDEDWPNIGDTNNIMMAFTIGKRQSFFEYLAKNIHTQEKCSNFVYREGVSPLSGMGKSLTGRFTKKEFVNIKEGVYFYNPDTRLDSLYEEYNREIDSIILHAITSLFTLYNQQSIIIAAGYDHIVAIEYELGKQGFKADDLVIDAELVKQKNPIIEQFIKNIQNNNYQAFLKKTSDNQEEIICALVRHPLDIKKIFETQIDSISSESILEKSFSFFTNNIALLSAYI